MGAWASEAPAGRLRVVVIANMYIGGKSCIKTDEYLSRDIACKSVVRPGDVLSPNLFISL